MLTTQGHYKQVKSRELGDALNSRAGFEGKEVAADRRIGVDEKVSGSEIAVGIALRRQFMSDQRLDSRALKYEIFAYHIARNVSLAVETCETKGHQRIWPVGALIERRRSSELSHRPEDQSLRRPLLEWRSVLPESPLRYSHADSDRELRCES